MIASGRATFARASGTQLALAIVVSLLRCGGAWHDETIDLDAIPPEERMLEAHYSQLPVVASHALALSSGDICVAESAIHRVRLLASDGTPRRKVGDSRGAALGQWYDPSALVEAEEEGLLFIADSGNNRIIKINISDGNDTVVAFANRCGHEEDTLNFPVGLALLDGTLFVADFGNHRVAAFDAVATGGPMDPDKSLVFRFEIGRKGIAGGGASEFNLPRGLTTHNGQLIVADMLNHRLKVYTSDGQLVRTIGLEGTDPGHFKMPSDVASFAGKLFVAEYEGRRLQVLEPDGTPLQVFAPAEWRGTLGTQGVLIGGAKLQSVYVSADAVRVSDVVANTVYVLSFRQQRVARQATEAHNRQRVKYAGYRVPKKRDEL